MESCRLCSVIAAGSKSVKIVCRCADRRSTVGAAASFGLDGSDVMGATRRIASGSGLSRRDARPARTRDLPRHLVYVGECQGDGPCRSRTVRAGEAGPHRPFPRGGDRDIRRPARADQLCRSGTQRCGGLLERPLRQVRVDGGGGRRSALGSGWPPRTARPRRRRTRPSNRDRRPRRRRRAGPTVARRTAIDAIRRAQHTSATDTVRRHRAHR